MATNTKVLRLALPLAMLASVSSIAVNAQAAVTTTGTSGATTTTSSTTSNTVKPMWGSVTPFWGSVTPFWGSVTPFWGSVTPFWGSVTPFSGGGSVAPLWGSVTPFDGATTQLNPYNAPTSSVNGVSAFWGTTVPYTNNMTAAGLNTYWQNTGVTMKNIDSAWGAVPAGSAASAYAPLVTQLNTLNTNSQAFWDLAIKAKTGGVGYKETVVDPLYAKYGIVLSNPATLASLDQTKRALFFLDFYDSLMNYTGTDHIDYWMNLVRWSPSLTQTLSSGTVSTIGLLDLTVSGTTTVSKNIVAYDGVSTFNNGHGVAVGSLMVGAHDGKGVMGIAPRSKVIAYNPFDASGTTNWTDITTGVIALTKGTTAYAGASIVNASLGEPGLALSPGWNTVFTSTGVSAVASKTVFVIAAGNEGATQTTNVAWNFATNPDILIVGSVGVDGTISSFSNRPGNACLLPTGTTVCAAGNYLKDRFLVAPGDLILVDDDKGGVSRQSGTSFAAPLVSGAVALLHDRWRWLATYPKVTENILLSSAKDLGDPGVDAVYGHGLLDITAAESPLDLDKLAYYTGKKNSSSAVSTDGTISTSGLKATSVATVIKDIRKDKQKAWNAQGLYYYAIEEFGATTGALLDANAPLTGTRTRRDFAIPVARNLIGQNIVRASGETDKFQAYLTDQLEKWVAAKPAFAEAGSNVNFAGFATGVAMRNPWGADMSLSVAPVTKREGFVQSGAAYQSRLHVAGDGSEAEFGFGDGAVTLGAMPGLAQANDYDATRGGANPLLGLASGGAFGKVAFNLTENLQVSAGSTQRNDLRDTNSSPGLRVLGNGAERYKATAANVGVNLKVAEGVHVLGGLTHLTEASGLLGVQSMDANDLGAGSTTDGYNIGVDAALGPKTRLAITGTVGTTRTHSGQAFAASNMKSTAYEVSLTHGDLFAKGDVARISVSQPLYVEKGDIAFTSYQIANRDTGDLGLVTQHISLSAPRPFATEMLYGRPVLKGAGEVSFYGRVDADSSGSETTYMSGARFKLRF